MSTLIDREPEYVKDLLRKTARVLYLASNYETINRDAYLQGILPKEIDVRDLAHKIALIAEEVEEI